MSRREKRTLYRLVRTHSGQHVGRIRGAASQEVWPFGKAQPYRTEGGRAAGNKAFTNFLDLNAPLEDAASSIAL